MAKVLYQAKRRLPRSRVYTMGAACIRRAYIAVWLQRIQYKRSYGVVILPSEEDAKRERRSPEALMWYDEAHSMSQERAAHAWAQISPRCMTWTFHWDPSPRREHYNSPIKKED